LRAKEQTLEQFIFTNSFVRYSVPYYQRPYKWKKDQIDDFWNDLTDNKQNFIGPLVLQEDEDGTKTVVDGQQRLITSTIFACVLRDLYKKYEGLNQYSKIKERYINTEDDEGEVIEYRLKTGPNTEKFLGPYLQDDDFVCQFKRIEDLYTSNLNKKEKFISQEFYNRSKKIFEKEEKRNNYEKLSDKKISQLEAVTAEELRIKENYMLLYSKVEDYISHQNTNKEKINKLSVLRDELKTLQIVVITIYDLDNAYEVFERLNNFGVVLTQADLLKNHILKNVKPNQVKKCHDNWISMANRIGEENLVSFIRYYWMSKNKFTQKNKLFNTISNSEIDYTNFLNELIEASEIYETIADDNQFFDELKIDDYDITVQINNLKKAIKTIGTTQPITFLICLVTLINDKNLKVNPSKFLLLLENFLFQYFAIGNNPGNSVERLFSNISNELYETTKKEPKHVVKEQDRCFQINTKRIIDIYSEYVNKDAFYESFLGLKYSSRGKPYKINRYILEKYEYYIWEKNNKISRELDINLKNVNQEHLLPQNPQLWGFSKEDVSEYVNSIGNLFLIDIKLNRKMQNDVLIEKMKFLKKSKFESVNLLVKKFENEKFEWGKKEIDERANSIADAAWNHIWKIDC
tara:strand:- start:1524 stop:3419 length:1896 start_codon:yes stop_codon:yes gene_type:complete